LGITDLEEIEVACLMRVLAKPTLENAILLQELVVIMENFGIYEDDAEPENIGENNIEEDTQGKETPIEGKKPKKKKAAKQMDLSLMDEKSIKVMAKLMLALMELNVSLYEFFEGCIYE